MIHSSSHAIRHSSVTTLDTAIRLAWFNQGKYGLADALTRSASRKGKHPSRKHKAIDDSIAKGTDWQID